MPATAQDDDRRKTESAAARSLFRRRDKRIGFERERRNVR
jgi:hypothetical protein